MQVATKIALIRSLVSIVLSKDFQLLHWGAVSEAKKKRNLTPVSLRCAAIFTEFESEYTVWYSKYKGVRRQKLQLFEIDRIGTFVVAVFS